MDYAKFGDLQVSRFILGSNPFSGFSHQSPEMDRVMMSYYKTERIKETLHQAELLGVNTLIARTDNHVLRLLLEFRDEGGDLQWFAQTCPEVGPQPMCVERAINGGAVACHVHGGWMDWLMSQGRLEESIPVVEQIREAGMLAGVAGHRIEVIRWAVENLPVDYLMCSYYNPIPRDKNPLHVSGLEEIYEDSHREAITGLIRQIPKPVIHYKIMAAGRNDPQEAFEFAASKMRDMDAVCVGVYTAEKPDMIAEDIRLLEQGLAQAG